MIAALVFVPIIAALIIGVLPRGAYIPARVLGALTSAGMLVLSWYARRAPDNALVWLQRPFTAVFHFSQGTGLSFWLVALTALVTLSAVLAARVPRLVSFIALLLLLEGTMTGVFVARDLLMFALFWDLMLLPVFFVLIGWGGHTTAAWRYLLYNAVGGLALLLATAAFGIANGTTDIIGHAVYNPIGEIWGAWIFAGLAFAFLIKTPIWPLHTWMPETYSELPPPMVAVVSAVQSKAGLYGLITICAPFFSLQFMQSAPLFTTLGLVGLLYGGCIALVQRDMKRVVAYSSLSHLGLIIIAIASGNHLAVGGAILYMIGHGLFSAALFLVLGYVELREDTRSLKRLGGLAKENPKLAGAFIFAALAALGLPGLAGFAGELIILTGLFQAGEVVVALLALIPIVLAAAYMLRLFQGVMQGPELPDLPQRPDLGWLEIAAFTPLAVGIILLGIAPRTLIESPEATMHGLNAVHIETHAAPHSAVRVAIAKGEAR